MPDPRIEIRASTTTSDAAARIRVRVNGEVVLETEAAAGDDTDAMVSVLADAIAVIGAERALAGRRPRMKRGRRG